MSYFYQWFSALADDEYAALKADIAKRGVLVPIERDEHGMILDGHHRDRAVRELRAEGVKVPDPPVKFRTFASENDKIAHILTLNLARRHLTTYQRTQLEADLRLQGWSFRRIAQKIGVNASTVQRDLVRVASAIPEADQDDDGPPVANATPARSVGRDGKSYPRSSPKRGARLPVERAEPAPPSEPVGVRVAVSDVMPEPATVEVRTVDISDGPDLPERVKRWLMTGIELVEHQADGLVVLEYQDDAERLWAGLGRLLHPVRPVGKVRHRGTARHP